VSTRHPTGPGDLPVVDVKVDPERWNLADEGGFAAAAPELAREAGLEYFVEEHLDQPEAPKLILILDEPQRTAPRVALAVALAAELIRWDKKVLVLDGDDHRPDLTRWMGRLDSEGWVDVIRYGISVDAASVPLPFAPKQGRVLGVGSYQPTRVSAEEVAEFVRRQSDAYDHIIVTASTGDRGSVWASQPALSLVCWTPGIQHESVIEGIIHDAGLLGETPRAIMQLVGRPEGEAPVSKEELAAFAGEGGNSSPVFRRLAGLLAVLVVLLAVWWFGFVQRGGDEEPAVAARDAVADVAQHAGAASDHAADAVGETAAGLAEEVRAEADDLAGRTEGAAADLADSAEQATDALADRADAAAAAAGRDAEAAGETEARTAAAADPAPARVEAAPRPRETPAANADMAGLDPAAFDGEVGAAGWCLHLYSLRHQEVAEQMTADLERKGIRGRIVPSRDDQGEYWYRVYVGSFATRDEARAAEPALMRLLEIDYAAPRRAADLF